MASAISPWHLACCWCLKARVGVEAGVRDETGKWPAAVCIFVRFLRFMTQEFRRVCGAAHRGGEGEDKEVKDLCRTS